MKNYQDKLIIQVVVCLAIFALVRGSAMVGGETVTKIKDAIREQAQRNYTVEDIKKAGDEIAGKIVNAPAALVSVITDANEAGEFAPPINEEENDEMQAVHAVSDGVVAYAGIDKELGMCVKITHKDKTSTYGNLYTLTVITGDKVKKGDIIASIDRKNGKELFYQLDDNVA